MKIVNPNYAGGPPTGITPARWTTMLTAARSFIAAHPEIAYFDVAAVIALAPELADPNAFQQFLTVLGLTVVG